MFSKEVLDAFALVAKFLKDKKPSWELLKAIGLLLQWGGGVGSDFFPALGVAEGGLASTELLTDEQALTYFENLGNPDGPKPLFDKALIRAILQFLVSQILPTLVAQIPG